MSSLRNAIQRRNHKERSQPQERAKWGLLEKRKDYSLRAKDHNEKKRKLKALQQKASQRNEDEFYFGMMSSQTHGGRKVAVRGEENSGGSGKSLSMDVVKLMKTQDAAYLRTVLQSTRRARERLEEEVAMPAISASDKSVKHGKIYFHDDTVDDALTIHSEPQSTGKVQSGRLSPSEDEVELQHETIEREQKPQLTPQEKAERRKKRNYVYVQRRRLEALRGRENSLVLALREVEGQRARMNGTAGGVNKAGIKYKVRERRR